MMDEMSKLLGKRKPSEMSEEDKQAKMEVVHELLQMAMDAMGHDVKSGLDGMKKVEVQASSPEALEEGLDKAQELVGSGLADEEVEPSDEAEAETEMPELEEAESEEEQDEEDKPKKRPIFDLL